MLWRRHLPLAAVVDPLEAARQEEEDQQAAEDPDKVDRLMVEMMMMAETMHVVEETQRRQRQQRRRCHFPQQRRAVRVVRLRWRPAPAEQAVGAFPHSQRIPTRHRHLLEFLEDKSTC